ncbi:MAG: DUF5615 family PIN-like protein [Planctomycetota bacterium]|jgi:predicted nuclease of predicted toxin-antitoxin system
MSVRYLLDEMISPRVAERAKRRGLDVKAVDQSEYDGCDDKAVFQAAVREKRILVTYNVRDFEPLLGDMLDEHGAIPGIVFVNRDTIPTSDIGGLVRALGRLGKRIESGEIDPAMGIWLSAES